MEDKTINHRGTEPQRVIELWSCRVLNSQTLRLSKLSKLKYLAPILLLLCVFAGFCGFAVFSLAQEEADQRLNTFELSEYRQDGKKKWHILGESANILDKFVYLRNVALTAYGDENTATLSAAEGTYNRESQDMQLEKDVLVTTADGARLTTDSLDWHSNEKTITTEDNVLISRNNIQTSGRGGSFKSDLKFAQVINDVEVEINDHNPTVITCDGPLEVDYEKNLAKFYNNVIITDERGKIFADSMDVILNPKTNTVERVLAVGNVKIIRGDDTTYSDKAEYIAAEGRVILTGKPKLVIYPKDE